MSVVETAIEDRVPTGPGGRPFAFGMDGNPATLRDASELLSDMGLRTLCETELVLPTGVPAVVRTLCLVFDHGLATCVEQELPRSYQPEVFASACYWGEELRQFVQPLWTYSSPEEARLCHPEAVQEFASGRAHVAA